MVGQQWHMADFHDKVRRDGRDEFGLPRAAQTQGHAMRAVGVNDATGLGIVLASGSINVAMQMQGFAGLSAADLLALRVDFGQLRGL
jgi:hypothetical protein